MSSTPTPSRGSGRRRGFALAAVAVAVAGFVPAALLPVTPGQRVGMMVCAVFAETLALVLGLAAWRERAGKIATVTAAVALCIAAIRVQGLFPAGDSLPLASTPPAEGIQAGRGETTILPGAAEMSVAELLAQAELDARQKHWAQARDAYLRALEHPDFDWRQFEHKSPSRCLALQMGLAFQRAGDTRNHERLCAVLLELDGGTPVPSDADRYSKTLLTNWKSLSPKIRDQAIALARFGVDGEFKKIGRNTHWICQTGGIAEYRAGAHERAIELLEQAEGNPDVACRGGAQLYRAMALQRLGRAREAATVLQEAEQLLAGPLQTRSGASWWDLDLCELALVEARALIRSQ